MYDFRTYMLIGGMPQVVKAYTEKRPPKEIDALKRMIINLYGKRNFERHFQITI